jgi:hydroxymethyl cephem carbamoyltransferase
MLVIGVTPGHDGAVCAIEDRKLLFCYESEKDSFPRHNKVTPMTILDAMERVGGTPDVIAFGGWLKESWWYHGGSPVVGAGYMGADVSSIRDGKFCGRPVKMFSSSHIRSHIMMGAGMAPPDDEPLRAILVWEGYDGTFYLVDDRWEIVREIPALLFPGGRYSMLFAIAEPAVPDSTTSPSGDYSGKLMALAAYGNREDADPAVVEAVERLVAPSGFPRPKGDWVDAPFYNVGVEAEVTKTAAAYLHSRIFEIYAEKAVAEIPAGIPLYISGGCGLNCDWNTDWRELGHFSSVFVPPCANDSGAAIGHALDALHSVTGDPRIEWDVYCGLEFEWDQDPPSGKWRSREMDMGALADSIAGGTVVAWVQGRWELGPRALGNRSLIAEPFSAGTRGRLNDIKLREGYRPIAPCCRIEDAGKVYDRDFHDPYMLYFRMATTPDLKAVTHVDGSARVQTVTKESNPPQHRLLTAFAERHGVGVLCNTSLNYKVLGFINKMSDLADYCEKQGVDDMVVGDRWFERLGSPVRIERPKPRQIREQIEQHVPAGATVLVVSGGLGQVIELGDRQGLHFPQKEDGTHDPQLPVDSDSAIAHLEQLRDRGASHLVFSKADLWWFERYGGLHSHLFERYRPILDNDVCLIFSLDGVPMDDSDPMREAPAEASAP